ncbi:MAG: lycopene cyclase domain-containing protein [Bacteroidota bacterium]
MSVYGWVILFSIAGPFALSFDKKVNFIRYWKPILISVVCVGIPFLIWDELFTQLEVWGFNSTYLFGIYLGHLPLEEVLFFLVVPYCCVFIHEVLTTYFPNMKLDVTAKFFGIIMLALSIILVILNPTNYYTLSACSLTSIYILIAFIRKFHWFSSFAFTYLVCLIPFLIVNGILTGSMTDEPIVWYSEKHITGFRILTIPFEDLFYNFSFLFPIIWIFENLKAKFHKN